MNSRFDTLETRMASMEIEQQSMKQDISSIKETTATKEDVAEIPAIKMAVMETSEEVKKIKSTQERHERTFDLLSRPSIDQEAAINELRQII